MIGTFAIRRNHKSSSQTLPKEKLTILRFYSFIILLSFLNIQCKKSAPPPVILPPVTQEGKNTFGCKVNGEVWRPYATCHIFYGRQCMELGFEVFTVDTLHKLPISFYLGSKNNTDTSAFEIYTRGSNIVLTGNIIDSVVPTFWKGPQFYTYMPVQTPGVINVTKLDTVNNIMAGTFSFTLYDSNNDSVVVTDGRFDLTFNACLCRL